MRVCPGCRTVYEEHIYACPKDGLPLLDRSRTQDAGFEQGGAPVTETKEAKRKRENTRIRPGVLIGEYKVENVLAEGGMGVIYAGIHPVISKRVAIKVLNKRFAEDPKAVSRFVLEARSVNEIGHHNIVDIFSIGELDDQRNYLIMELLDGLALHEILHRERRLPAGVLLPIYEQLCDALKAAHVKGFVHRDLKPDNVIVLRRPPYPFIKILDFGLAKLRGSGTSADTEVGTVLGTPEYMAPEQCRGSSVDARTDIYALGVMLFELVTGRRPFADPSPLRVLTMQQREPPPPPSSLIPMSPDLEYVILKAMTKEPELRFQTADEFLQHLRHAAGAPQPWTASLAPLTREEIRRPREVAPSEPLVFDAPPERGLPAAPRINRQFNVPSPLSVPHPAGASGELEDDELDTMVRNLRQNVEDAEELLQRIRDQAGQANVQLEEHVRAALPAVRNVRLAPMEARAPVPYLGEPQSVELSDMGEPDVAAEAENLPELDISFGESRAAAASPGLRRTSTLQGQGGAFAGPSHVSSGEINSAGHPRKPHAEPPSATGGSLARQQQDEAAADGSDDGDALHPSLSSVRTSVFFGELEGPGAADQPSHFTEPSAPRALDDCSAGGVNGRATGDKTGGAAAREGQGAATPRPPRNSGTARAVGEAGERESRVEPSAPALSRAAKAPQKASAPRAQDARSRNGHGDAQPKPGGGASDLSQRIRSLSIKRSSPAEETAPTREFHSSPFGEQAAEEEQQARSVDGTNAAVPMQSGAKNAEGGLAWDSLPPSVGRTEEAAEVRTRRPSSAPGLAPAEDSAADRKGEAGHLSVVERGSHAPDEGRRGVQGEPGAAGVRPSAPSLSASSASDELVFAPGQGAAILPPPRQRRASALTERRAPGDEVATRDGRAISERDEAPPHPPNPPNPPNTPHEPHSPRQAPPKAPQRSTPDPATRDDNREHRPRAAGPAAPPPSSMADPDAPGETVEIKLDGLLSQVQVIESSMARETTEVIVDLPPSEMTSLSAENAEEPARSGVYHIESHVMRVAEAHAAATAEAAPKRKGAGIPRTGERPAHRPQNRPVGTPLTSAKLDELAKLVEDESAAALTFEADVNDDLPLAVSHDSGRTFIATAVTAESANATSERQRTQKAHRSIWRVIGLGIVVGLVVGLVLLFALRP